jgi:hypothetical protein
MLLQRHHDLDHDLDRRLDDLGLLVLHQFQLLVNDMDLVKLVHHQYVEGNFLNRLHLYEVHQDELQIQDEQNLDVHQSYLGEVHLDAERLHLADVAVDAELRHQLKMDYYQGEV